MSSIYQKRKVDKVNTMLCDNENLDDDDFCLQTSAAAESREESSFHSLAINQWPGRA